MDTKNSKKTLYTDNTADKSKKERGDNRRDENMKKNALDESKKHQHAMGDLKRKVQEPKDIQKKKNKPEKQKLGTIVYSNNKRPGKESVDDSRSKLLDLIERRKLRDKYTFRFYNATDVTLPVVATTEDVRKRREKTDVKNDRVPKSQSKDTNLPKERPLYPSAELSVLPISKIPKTEKEGDTQRKPIIKNVTSKNDTKIYKAVTFIDQKKKTKVLQVKIPRGVTKSKIPLPKIISKLSIKEKHTSTSKLKDVSVTSMKERRKRNKNRRNMIVSSPDLSRAVSPPPSEVAKWAPTCINDHTKPYYEAWVTTTPTAISTHADIDLEREKIFKSFQERAYSPELVYENMKDEKYTGKIKISQRQR